MSKLLIGAIAVPVIAVGGYFAAEAYVQHRVASEIEANFAQIRANGGQAKRGDLTVSLLHRTISIADISIDFPAPQAANIKIGRFAASGIALSDAKTFSAGKIAITDLEAGGVIAASGGMAITTKAPSVEILDYSGPTQFQGQIKPASPLDLYRAGLVQFAAMRAQAITAPSMTVNATGSAMPGGAEYVYSDLAMRDIKDGKIATSTAARAHVSIGVMQAGKPVRMTGDIVDITARDFDGAAAAVVLDPAHADDTRFYRVQGPVSAGTYSLTSESGPAFHIDGIRLGDMKVQPAKFKLQQLLGALPAPGTTPDPAQARALLEHVANLYEAIQIDNAEMRGLSVDAPQGPVKLAAMRFNLDRGKIGEFAVEGLDGTSPEGPFKIGRFALKGFDFSGMMRQLSQISEPGAEPSTDKMVGLLKALESVELKDMVVPYKKTSKTVGIETASLSWGQFVGPIPSKAHLGLKITGPIEDSDGEPFALLRSAGLDQATIGADIGLNWTEATRKLTLTPGAVDMGGMFALTAETTLDNVERSLFSTNPQQVALTAMLIKPTTLTLTLRDLGGLDLIMAQTARRQGISPEAARSDLLATIQSNAQLMADRNPAAGKVATALAAFIEKPHGLLTVHITPKQSVPLLQLIQTLKLSGPEALSMFDIDAQAGP